MFFLIKSFCDLILWDIVWDWERKGTKTEKTKLLNKRKLHFNPFCFLEFFSFDQNNHFVLFFFNMFLGLRKERETHWKTTKKEKFIGLSHSNSFDSHIYLFFQGPLLVQCLGLFAPQANKYTLPWGISSHYSHSLFSSEL